MTGAVWLHQLLTAAAGTHTSSVGREGLYPHSRCNSHYLRGRTVRRSAKAKKSQFLKKQKAGCPTLIVEILLHAKAWGMCAGTQGPASNAVFASDGSIHDGLGIKLRQHMAV